jgi:hypothetical protein
MSLRERPIIFGGPMVQAILAGTKTQTRRVVTRWVRARQRSGSPLVDHCPYGVPGDRLWVREMWAPQCDEDLRPEIARPTIFYAAGWTGAAIRWRSSVSMPRWASRITLELTEVRVQRLQEISEEDAKAEGIIARGPGSPTLRPHQRDFRGLWNDINAKRGYGWDSNPWVWAITFKRGGVP